ncbi:MAG: SDR family oxidoreductase [Minisyncoccia bacterium]
MSRKKVIVIVGATGVLGSSIAEKFTDSDAELVLTCSTRNKIKLLKGSMTEVVDVTSDKSVKNFFKKVQIRYKKIDVLITAFGVYGSIGLLSDIDPRRWENAINVNLFGNVKCFYYAIPLLKKSKNGKIITFAGGGEGAKPNFTSYVSSKMAVVRLIETLGEELKDNNIDVNAISPGPIKSRFTEDIIKAGAKLAGKKSFDEAKEQMSGRKETVDPKLIANLVEFLSSSDSDGITGKNISAVHDPWRDFSNHKKDIINSKVYTFHRIKPKEEGYDW